MLDKDNDYVDSEFVSCIDKASKFCYEASKAKGFYDNERHNNGATKILLMITELSEAFESIRKDTYNQPSEHIANYTQLEEELADCIIRILDFAGWQGLRLGAVIITKIKFNETRPYKHDKQF